MESGQCGGSSSSRGLGSSRSFWEFSSGYNSCGSLSGLERSLSRLDTLPECASCEERSPCRSSAAERLADLADLWQVPASPTVAAAATARAATAARKLGAKSGVRSSIRKVDEEEFNRAAANCCGDISVGKLVYICLVSSLKRLRDSYVACMLVAASSSRVSHVGLVMGNHFLGSTNFCPSSRFDDDFPWQCEDAP